MVLFKQNFIFSWLFLMRRIKRVWKFQFYQNIQLVNDVDLQSVDEMP